MLRLKIARIQNSDIHLFDINHKYIIPLHRKRYVKAVQCMK